MTGPTLRLLGGWRDAVRVLGPSPLRWWISPALADEAFASAVRPGDRVLVRGAPEDVESGASDLELLRWLVHAGVEVRRHPRLAFSAYVAVHPADGDEPRRAHAMVGSAEATPRGRGDRYGGTLNAMAGPFPLSDADIDAVDAVWREAETLDPDALAAEIAALRGDREREALAVAAGGRWVVRIEIDAASARWTPPHGRREDGADAAMGDEGAVAFLPARHRLRRDVVAFSRALRTRLRSDGLLAALPGELGTNAYLVAAERNDELRALLDLADERLRDRFVRRVEPERDRLATDFAARVEAVLVAQAGRIPAERGVAPDWSATRAEAMRSFDAFLAAAPVSVRYALSVPVGSNDPAYRGAAATLQPTLLPSVGDDAAALVEDALDRAGLSEPAV